MHLTSFLSRGLCFLLAAWFWLQCTPASAAAPQILAVTPVSGIVTQLTTIKVVFSKPVTGLDAAHFLINDTAATAVTGSGTQYTFTLTPPKPGTVLVRFGDLHQVQDLETPSNRLDANAPGAVWTYLLIDPLGPSLVSILPPPSTTLSELAQLELRFQRPVEGLDAGDLLINGVPARQVEGIGAGPFRVTFDRVAAGPVHIAWNPSHQITSDDPVPQSFRPSEWDYLVDSSAARGPVVLTELVAENNFGKKDEDLDPEDWIEVQNRGTQLVNLGGWTLSRDRDDPSQWVFPSTNLGPGKLLVVWASGKDRRVPGKPLHTNFKLNPNGDTLQLFSPELPRRVSDEVSYPEQGPDFSYGRFRIGASEEWRYFQTPTWQATNAISGAVTNKVAEVHFSVSRGIFDKPFDLSLVCTTPDALIRYTTNGSPPLGTNGFIYTLPIPLKASRVIRASAYLTNHLPSRVQTHSYLFLPSAALRRLPALSLVTAPNNLFGPSGIMEYNPRNTDKHGPSWERPVSAELIRMEDNQGFQVDAGLRVQGGGYIRTLYNYTQSAPQGKYSFRLYFRGEYGQGRLKYPWLPNTTVDSFDTIVLRAGQNDHSNPYIRDELARQLASDTGQPASHGTFVNLFLNGVYKGYYNPVERIETEFLQAYHGSRNAWDVIGSVSELRDGDLSAWNQLLALAQSRPATNHSNYFNLGSRLDLTNFIDYLLVPIYADTDDWPHNNWRAARERVPGGLIRFYLWDAEQSFGVSHDVSFNTISGQLSSTSPPWGAPEIATIFNSLKRHPEFKQLFADRVHRHLYNSGALTDENIKRRYQELKLAMAPTIGGIDDSIGSSWIPNRRRWTLRNLHSSGFLGSSNAPVFNQFGGSVPAGFELVMTNQNGILYYSTNGTDPRVPISATVSGSALIYNAPIAISSPVWIKARSLSGTNWSALTETQFVISELASPVRISEVMYRPPGGEAYEFVELWNSGSTPVDLSGYGFAGIEFRFGTPFPLFPANARWILGNGGDTNLFRARYPGLPVAGWFEGALNNGGERLTLVDATGRRIDSVRFQDRPPWPEEADGGGASLERSSLATDSDAAETWQASDKPGGSPGLPSSTPPPSTVVLNEIMAGRGTASDWVELINLDRSGVDLAGWSLSDRSNTRPFVFPSGTTLAPGQLLLVHCDTNLHLAGFHTGFELNADGEVVALYTPQGHRADVVTLGPSVPDHTLGRAGDFLSWELCEPTPAQTNLPAELGTPESIAINEFLAAPAAPAASDNWIEFHNLSQLPISLKGCYVGTSNALFRIRSPLYVGASGFLVLRENVALGLAELPMSLPPGPGALFWYDASGLLISKLSYAAGPPGVAQGRLPNGVGTLSPFPFQPSPGASNFNVRLGEGLRLNEIMARHPRDISPASGPATDWFELFNPGPDPVNLDGYLVEIRDTVSQSWKLNSSAIVGAGEYRAIECNPQPSGIGPWVINHPLPDVGGMLSISDAQGRLIDKVSFGFQMEGRSVGRSGAEWKLLSRPSPSESNAPPATLGAVGSVKFNEWLSDGWSGVDWVELHNPESQPVLLSGCFLTDDPSLAGISNHVVFPLSFIDALGYVRFFADNQPKMGPDHLPFQLDALGESIRLYSTSRVIIDALDLLVQEPGVSEGRYPDGSTNRIRFPNSATPSAANQPATDVDQDRIPDAWELTHGLNPADPSDAARDFDGDGVSNLDEFRSSTNPRDPASLLQVSIQLSPEGAIRIGFTAQAEKAYTLQTRASLLTGAWTVLKSIPPSSVSRSIEVALDGGSNSGAESRQFFQVLLRE